MSAGMHAHRPLNRAELRLGLNSAPRTPVVHMLFDEMDDARRLLSHEVSLAADLYDLRNAYQRCEQVYLRAVEILDIEDASPVDLRLVLPFLGHVSQQADQLRDAIIRLASLDRVPPKKEAVEHARRALLATTTERETLAVADRAELDWRKVRDADTTTTVQMIVAGARLEAAYINAIGRASSAGCRTEHLIRLYKLLAASATEIERYTNIKEI